MAEFLGCTCCQDRSEVMDWTKTYSLPERHDPNDPNAKPKKNVRIPLPFSRTWDPTQDKLTGSKTRM